MLNVISNIIGGNKVYKIITFSIVASNGPNGSISSAGTSIIVSSSNKTYTITCNTGFQIADVLVDGISVGAVSHYTFTSITANHTISVTFEAASSRALNKSAIAQSFETGNIPANAVDSDSTNATFWSANPYPQWWKVDLGASYDISSVVVRNYVGDGRIYHYELYSSLDDILYTKFAEKTNDNVAQDSGDTYNTVITGRYLKINITFHSNNTGVHLTDFRVYGNLT